VTVVAAWKLVVSEGQAFSLEQISFDTPPESLNAAGEVLPQGVFTTFRTYKGSKAFLLTSHFDRLENSAALLGYSINISRGHIRAGLRHILKGFGSEEARVRLVVDLEEQPGRLFIAVEPLMLPTRLDYKNGVEVVTCREQRENPEAKQTAFISKSENLRRHFPPQVFEGLLVDEDGCIREGFTSNVYFVKDGEVWTPGEGILSGVSRNLLLEAIEKANISLRFGCIPLSEVGGGRFKEAFLTSSTRAVLPIRKIDENLVGNGKPGPITKILTTAYDELLLKKLKAI
jgi:branched-chain amino acid aminotransferase